VINFSKIGTSGRSSFLDKALLYFSIVVLVIISFFPILQRCIPSTNDLYFQADNALFMLMIDNLLNVQDSESDASGDNDDDPSSDDFLSAHFNNWTLDKSFSRQQKKIPVDNPFPDSFPLKKFTPPPKS